MYSQENDYIQHMPAPNTVEIRKKQERNALCGHLAFRNKNNSGFFPSRLESVSVCSLVPQYQLPTILYETPLVSPNPCRPGILLIRHHLQVLQ